MLLPFIDEGGGLLDQLGINPKVILVQAVLLLLAFWLLRRFLFGPVVDFTRRREEEIEAAARQIERNRAEMDRLAAEYKQKLAEIEKQANDRLQAAIKEGLAARAEIISRAEEEARAQLDAARAGIQQQKEEARRALREEVKRLAVEAAEKMTGRSLDAALQARIVEEVLSEQQQ